MEREAVGKAVESREAKALAGNCESFVVIDVICLVLAYSVLLEILCMEQMA